MARNRDASGMKRVFDGSSAELSLAATFRNWGWSTAKPEPDTGIDLEVLASSEPAGKGPSFVAQIKSGARHKSSVTLKQRSAQRLRDHVLPAFLFFVNRSTRRVKWVYLEPQLASIFRRKQNRSLCVPLKNSAEFALDTAVPPAELAACVALSRARGAVKAQPKLSGHARELKSFLRDIDPRFLVDVTFDGRSERYTIRAADKPEEVRFSLKVENEGNLKELKEAFEWGSPAELVGSIPEFEEFPILEHLTSGATWQETHITPHPRWEGTGTIQIEPEDRVAAPVAPPIPVGVVVRRGAKGAQFELNFPKRALQMRLRFGLDGTHGFTMSLVLDEIATQEPVCLQALRGLSALLGDMLNARTICLVLHDCAPLSETLRFKLTGLSVSLSESTETLRAERRVLEALESLGSLESELGFKVSANQLATIDPREAAEWVENASLINGEVVDLDQPTVTITLAGGDVRKSDLQPVSTYHIRTFRTVLVREHEMASFEVWAQLNGYGCDITLQPDGTDVLRFMPACDTSKTLLTRHRPCQLEEQGSDA